jgi:hypothetical protein
MQEAVSYTNKQQSTNTNVNITKSKLNKCRSTVFKCASKYSENCVEDKAIYYCNECKVNQCESCERELHAELENDNGHNRQKLQPIKNDLLCQRNCKTRNFADVYCYDCQLKFCYKCYDDHHKYLTKKHQNTAFPIQQQQQQQFKTQQQDEVPKKASKLQQKQHILLNDAKEDDEYFSLNANSENTEYKNKKPHLLSQKSMEQIDLNDSENVENLNINLGNYIDDDLNSESLLSCVDSYKSFLLIDENEKIQVKSIDEFLKKLNCKNDDKQVKCVSIFGNTG